MNRFCLAVWLAAAGAAFAQPGPPPPGGPPGGAGDGIWLRNAYHGSATAVTATIGGIDAEVSFLDAEGTTPGMDQYSILVPKALAGAGKIDVMVTVGGRQSNRVNVSIQ